MTDAILDVVQWERDVMRNGDIISVSKPGRLLAIWPVGSAVDSQQYFEICKELFAGSYSLKRHMDSLQTEANKENASIDEQPQPE